MPPPPVPPQIEAFLREANPAVVATLRADGSPHSVATWYDWEDGLVLLNMDATRKRLEHLRRDPRVALTVLDKDDWYSHVTLFGAAERLEDDPELVRHRPAGAALHGQAFPESREPAGERLGAPRPVDPVA